MKVVSQYGSIKQRHVASGGWYDNQSKGERPWSVQPKIVRISILCAIFTYNIQVLRNVLAKYDSPIINNTNVVTAKSSD